MQNTAEMIMINRIENRPIQGGSLSTSLLSSFDVIPLTIYNLLDFAPRSPGQNLITGPA
jgi:hypothetical protein